MKTIVYVDGYNLYYGLLKGSTDKWLDLYKLFNDYVLDDKAELIEIRYYTAPVLSKMSDNPESSQRQRTYIQALRKMLPQKTQIIEGQMIPSTPYLRLVTPIPEAPHVTKTQVYHFVEKKTDVNIAADMISDAWLGRCHQIVLCSNDSDHQASLAAIRKHKPEIRLGIVAPISSHDHRKISGDLTKYTDWQKKLSTVHIAAAQLPVKIPSTSITKPEGW